MTAQQRFASARVARLATVRPDGRPHLVPVCFALDGDEIFIAIDHKPKRTRALARLQNIRANPAVTLLADHYDDEDWTALWWARADGTASVGDLHDRALQLLRDRYPQYDERPPEGPLITVRVERWTSWPEPRRA